MPEKKATILERIAASTRERYRERFDSFDAQKPELLLRKEPRGLTAFLKSGFSIVAELKRASPSLGRLEDKLTFAQRLWAYEQGGAGALSILTEPNYFAGSLERLCRARELTDLPLLRKDFVIHPLMVYEAHNLGADWVLLIAALLGDDELHALCALCRSLGIIPLMEAHTLRDLERILDLKPELVGINGRDLHRFTVSMDTCLNLRRKVPDHIPVLAESGVSGAKDIRKLRHAGFCGALVGEALMRSSSPQLLLRDWLKT